MQEKKTVVENLTLFVPTNEVIYVCTVLWIIAHILDTSPKNSYLAQYVHRECRENPHFETAY